MLNKDVGKAVSGVWAVLFAIVMAGLALSDEFIVLAGLALMVATPMTLAVRQRAGIRKSRGRFHVRYPLRDALHQDQGPNIKR